MTIELTFEELLATYCALCQYDDEYASKHNHELYVNLITRLEQNKELREYYIELYKKYDLEWNPHAERGGC